MCLLVWWGWGFQVRGGCCLLGSPDSLSVQLLLGHLWAPCPSRTFFPDAWDPVPVLFAVGGSGGFVTVASSKERTALCHRGWGSLPTLFSTSRVARQEEVGSRVSFTQQMGGLAPSPPCWAQKSLALPLVFLFSVDVPAAVFEPIKLQQSAWEPENRCDSFWEWPCPCQGPGACHLDFILPATHDVK